jgi:hypothetical protein
MVGLRTLPLFLFLLALPLTAPAQTIKPPPTAAAPAKKPAPTKSEGSVLFEGYSKVLLGGVHIGYVVQRYEFDTKKKEFVSTYFLKTNALGGNVTESLKARATSGFKPVSYQYTEMVGAKTKTIDAAFSGDVMTAVVKDGDKPPTTIKKNLPKGTFPSTFLAYMMQSSKEGIKTGVRYGFNAIAEEDAGVYPGEAYVAGQEIYNGMPAFKVFNQFKGARFASYVTPQGDVLATRSPVQGIATEVVPSIKEATEGHSVTTSNLTLLFGKVPEGKQNAVARRASTSLASKLPKLDDMPPAAAGTTPKSSLGAIDDASAPAASPSAPAALEGEGKSKSE